MKKAFLAVVILFLFVCNSYGQTTEKILALANVKNIAHDYKGAIGLYDKAIALNPNNGLSYYNRGIAKLNLSDKTGACPDFKKASQLGYKKAEESISKFCSGK